MASKLKLTELLYPTSTTPAITLNADDSVSFGAATSFMDGGLIINDNLGVGTAGSPNYGTSGQVLTSAGSGAVPTWTTPSSGTGTVTSVGGTGSYGGLTLTGTVTTSGNLTLGGTPTGTWPISVSGNAATATALQTARTINGVSFNGTANITVADSTKLPLAGGNMTGLLATVGNAAAFTSANDTTLSVRSSGTGTAASMSFHRPGAYAVNLGLDTDNIFKLGGWSAGGVPHYWDMSGNAYATGSMRAPIFYDSNDTGYYCDPNGRSIFYQASCGAGFQFNGKFALLGSGASLDNSTGMFMTESFGALWNGTNSSTWHHQVINGSMLCGFTASGTNWGSGKVVANSDMRATIFYDFDDTSWYCDPNNTSRFRILSVPSNVGSGTFPVSVSSTDRGIIFGNSSGSGIPCYFTVNSGGTVSGSIIASGGSTSFNTSSDYRMKENDVDLDTDAALAKIMSLRPVTFDWKEQFGGRKGIGFIAHELDLIAPECVNGEKDAVNEDGTINPQSVDTSWLIPSMCSAMQKQQEIIEQLMAKVAVLEGI